MKNKFYGIVSILAVIEYLVGAYLVGEEKYSLGIWAMVMPLAWCGIMFFMLERGRR